MCMYMRVFVCIICMCMYVCNAPATPLQRPCNTPVCVCICVCMCMYHSYMYYMRNVCACMSQYGSV